MVQAATVSGGFSGYSCLLTPHLRYRSFHLYFLLCYSGTPKVCQTHRHLTAPDSIHIRWRNCFLSFSVSLCFFMYVLYIYIYIFFYTDLQQTNCVVLTIIFKTTLLGSSWVLTTATAAATTQPDDFVRYQWPEAFENVNGLINEYNFRNIRKFWKLL